jgi:alkyl hydroperoxide reductase subunit F
MDVAVIGNGYAALQAASDLAQIAKQVNVIGVPKKQLSSALGKKLQGSGKVNFLSDYEAKEIQGENSPEKLIVKSKANGNETEVPVKGVFVELGYAPNTSMFPRVGKRTKDGRIMVNARNQTNIPGLFAAGDVTDVNAQQVLIAMGEGANAALSAYDYLLSLKR